MEDSMNNTKPPSDDNLKLASNCYDPFPLKTNINEAAQLAYYDGAKGIRGLWVEDRAYILQKIREIKRWIPFESREEIHDLVRLLYPVEYGKCLSCDGVVENPIDHNYCTGCQYHQAFIEETKHLFPPQP